MKILLTNDDGYSEPGIVALYETLRMKHEVMLIAPDREKSAVGHGITINDPMRINKIKSDGNSRVYSITGTPADCVKLGLFEVYTSAPDLVVSGINPGSNAGVNINYSGTAGAAREAAINGIRGIAVSIFNNGQAFDFNGVAEFTATIVDKIHEYDLLPGTFLNINAPAIPVADASGIKITRQASSNISKNFEKRTDPKNRSYFWYGSMEKSKSEEDFDIHALNENYISITPIQCDATDYTAMSKLKSIKLL